MMIVKNGPLVVLLGALISVTAGGLGFYFSGGSIIITLIAAAVPLFLCTIYANFFYFNWWRHAPAPTVPVAVAEPAAAPVRRASILRSAFFYLTLGAVMLIWSGLWYWYLAHHGSAWTSEWYICDGLILTGLLLMIIGGLIYRAGNHINPRHPAASGY